MYAEKIRVTNTVLRIYAHWRVLEFQRRYAELFSFWLRLLILEFLRMYAEKFRVTNTVLRIYAHWSVLEFLRIYADTPAAWIVFNTTNVSTMRRSSNTGVSAAVRRYSKFGWKINSIIAHTSLTFSLQCILVWVKQTFRPCNVRDKVRTLNSRRRCQKFYYISRKRWRAITCKNESKSLKMAQI